VPSWTSDALSVPTRDGLAPFSRADLIFYEVDHSGPSYIARIFLNNTAADEATTLDDENRFAGTFTIFGHHGCAGDEGHCDVPTGPRDPFDWTPQHPLTPLTIAVEITTALGLITEDMVTVTVVPVIPAEGGPTMTEALAFASVRLVTYDSPR
jgi:tyrosinase